MVLNGYFNPYSMNVDRLKKQREELDNLIHNYQQQPINNFINTQTPPKNTLELRVLNETEEVDNLYVGNDTLFVGQNKAILKRVNGELEKYDIKKIYPVDEKEEKIKQLEEEIEKLKGMINNGNRETGETIKGEFQSNVNDNVIVESKTKTSSTKSSK